MHLRMWTSNRPQVLRSIWPNSSRQALFQTRHRKLVHKQKFNLFISLQYLHELISGTLKLDVVPFDLAWFLYHVNVFVLKKKIPSAKLEIKCSAFLAGAAFQRGLIHRCINIYHSAYLDNYSLWHCSCSNSCNSLRIHPSHPTKQCTSSHPALTP